jgi:hypothetical protein
MWLWIEVAFDARHHHGYVKMTRRIVQQHVMHCCPSISPIGWVYISNIAFLTSHLSRFWRKIKAIPVSSKSFLYLNA